MSKVDVSKIKVGDKITVEGVVTAIGILDAIYPIEVEFGNGVFNWVGTSNIIKHEPKFDPQVGDSVFNGFTNGIVKAIDGDLLWVRYDTGTYGNEIASELISIGTPL